MWIRLHYTRMMIILDSLGIRGRHFAKECRKPKSVKDSAYHKEKMLLCKQAEQGVPLYMAKIQEVPTADSGTDSEPVEQVQNDAGYNVFANGLQHFKQSESVSNTCLVETNDSNVIPDSPDICEDDIQNEQNDVESDDERVALTNLIANSKLNVDENKKIQKQLKKANTTLAQELKECKAILAETSQVKQKTKVITNLKLREEHDIEKILSMEKQLKFLNEVVYKRSQSIQTIHMMAPKVSTYNGRPTFANPRYLKQAQSEISCFYAFPYDPHTHANRLIPDGEETLDLERESRSKLNKDLVRPYDYTTLISLYEIFKPPTQEYEIQLAHANEIRKKIWRKSFVKSKPNIYKNIRFLPVSKSISKSRQAYNVMTNNINHFKEIVDNAWIKHSKDQFRALTAQDIEILIQTCLIPLSIKTQNDSFKFVHELKQEMHADLNPSVVQQTNDQRIPKPSVLGVNHNTNVSRPQLKSKQSRDKVLPNNSQVKAKKTQVEVHPRIPSVSNKMKSVTVCKDSLNSRTLNANVIVQLILFIVKSGCTKHMTGNLKMLCNFVEKFMGTVHFGNDQFALILGYGDLVQGNVTINRVYYVEGLNHNLFSVGQFCDADLEVAFRKSTCFVRYLQGNDLLTGNRRSDLYTISLQESTSSTPLCLMAKATPTQAWLWHRRLSYLNFDYINLLSKKDIVIGLPKLKYVKDQICSSCELSKAKRSSFKLKVVPSSKGRLNLLYIDLCGPMRVASINGKKYILVIVDDYSRYTWTLFLRSKDETPPKLKYVKDQLCSSCELSKAKRNSFKSKDVPSFKGRLNLLHMNLYGPMRVVSINGKKYILVIVDDYSRYTWTLFLRSKDETP
nr:retrovirus-related Pol polyprotein from transposon TNT 1-94 [Tanacetum cinerariifolium]